mgnify:CR=1 FL=1
MMAESGARYILDFPELSTFYVNQVVNDPWLTCGIGLPTRLFIGDL